MLKKKVKNLRSANISSPAVHSVSMLLTEQCNMLEGLYYLKHANHKENTQTNVHI